MTDKFFDTHSGFSVGDKVTRGNGKKVMEITKIRNGWGSIGYDKIMVALNGGTLYRIETLKKVK